MNEYELMIIALGVSTAIAWKFFEYLARMAIWRTRPKFDAMRYVLITVYILIEIGSAFEPWESVLLAAVSIAAYCAIKGKRDRFESEFKELADRAFQFSAARNRDKSRRHQL